MHGLLFFFITKHSYGLSCHGSSPSWHSEVAGLVETAQKTDHFFKSNLLCSKSIVVTNERWPPESVLCSWTLQPPAHLTLTRCLYWPGLSFPRGTSNKTSSTTQSKEVSWRNCDFMILPCLTCSNWPWGYQAWVLCWWHWPPDPSLCHPSSHWHYSYLPDEKSSQSKNKVAMAAISPVSCNSSQPTTTLWRSEGTSLAPALCWSSNPKADLFILPA